MGANIARRLSELGYEISSIYDHHHPIAEAMAEELGSVAATSFADVTALSDVIFTVVNC